MKVLVHKMEVIEAELLVRLKRSERKAISEVYDRYAPALYGSIVRIVKSNEIADNILEETFLALSYQAKAIKSHTSIFGWMFRYARQLAMDKTHPDERPISPVTTGQVSTELLNGLDKDCRDVVHLIHLESYTISQVSQMLDLPKDIVIVYVKSALSYIRLRARLDAKNVLL